jgi:hypothetical protein
VNEKGRLSLYRKDLRHKQYRFNVNLALNMHLVLTVGWDNPRSGEVSLVSNKNYRLVLRVVLAPKVVEDIFYSFECGAIYNGVHHNACVRLVRWQKVFNLKQTTTEYHLHTRCGQNLKPHPNSFDNWQWGHTECNGNSEMDRINEGSLIRRLMTLWQKMDAGTTRDSRSNDIKMNDREESCASVSWCWNCSV